MKNLLAPIVHSSRKFSYHSEERQFATEASTLGSPFFSQIYNDACDVGFVIESVKTGVRKHFLCIRQKWAGSQYEPELVGWDFVEYDPKTGKTGPLSAVIFND